QVIGSQTIFDAAPIGCRIRDNPKESAMKQRWILPFVLLFAAGAAASAQVRTPEFRAEPSWPVIPNNWVFGEVSSIAVDSKDHVWILQRPRTVPAEQQTKAAPPVLEFDASGKFIQSWGGPGAGYDWPEREHGIYIDPKGFVWIGGNNGYGTPAP